METNQQVLEKIQEFFAHAGLCGVFRHQAENEYEFVIKKIPYCPVLYIESSIDYQVEYFKERSNLFLDISIVITFDGKSCGIWPLSIQKIDNKFVLGSSGGAILPPLFQKNFPEVSEKKIIHSCFKFIELLCTYFDIKYVYHEEPFLNKVGLSAWSRLILQKGGIGGIKYNLFQDLSCTLAQIKSTFRKSYKSLIAQGERYWIATVHSSVTESYWEEFQQIHFKASGKITRSKKTWDLQREAINSGDAFFIALKDLTGKMIGGGLFYLSAHEVCYSVGAYDRDLFSKPVAHLVQYRAIEEGIQRKLLWYSIGQRVFSFESDQVTNKEITISEFKQGFSSHVVCVPIFKLAFLKT